MLTQKLIQNKNVLLRADLDVPLEEGRVGNDFRLKALLPTIEFCLKYAKKTIIIGHLGRPNGKDDSLSLSPIRDSLKNMLNQPFLPILSGISPGESWTGETPLAIMENLRFDKREETPDRGFAQVLTEGAGVYVYEAFATYRDSTSLLLIPEVLPTCTGFSFDREVETLQTLLNNPPRPSLLLASGSKQNKLEIIKKINPIFDKVLLGGLFAKSESRTPDGYDLNTETTAVFVSEILKARTIVLNGPVGRYEDGSHSKATRAILQAIIDSKAFSVVGGGDTLAAIPSLGFSYTPFSFVSTGGGAMLDFLATGTHPVLEVLKNAKLK